MAREERERGSMGRRERLSSWIQISMSARGVSKLGLESESSSSWITSLLHASYYISISKIINNFGDLSC